MLPVTVASSRCPGKSVRIGKHKVIVELILPQYMILYIGEEHMPVGNNIYLPYMHGKL